MEMRLTKKAARHIDRLCGETGVPLTTLVAEMADMIALRLDHTARRADVEAAMQRIIERDKAAEPPALCPPLIRDFLLWAKKAGYFLCSERGEVILADCSAIKNDLDRLWYEYQQTQAA